RPVNCFMAFRLEKHREISSRTPGLNHRDISKIIAKWWRAMSEEEKAPYRAIASKAKADHE
ncbi:high mobility group box domain-containing protein, partial [Absidia repens]